MKEMLQSFKRLFPNRFKKRVKNTLVDLMTIFHGRNLDKLAAMYKTDKWGSHYFTQHYQRYFRPFKYRRIKLLEIGVGGYLKPQGGGQSLRMWKRYFPFGKIFSIDIYDKSFLNEPRVTIWRGSQVDPVFLAEVVRRTGPLDLIIDDGSHHNDHVFETFKLLFPHLKQGGIYAIEDTQTSYWDDFGGDSHDIHNPKTTINRLKTLIDGLEYREYAKSTGHQPSYFDQNIVGVHFYHNLVFIFKGTNDEQGMRD
jgi:demethylmacrocin O-methyltransferase